MCERHDKTKLKYELLARVQPSDDRKSNYNLNYSLTLFFISTHMGITHIFTSATSTFVEICVHEQTKMKPNFPLNLILIYYNFPS